MCDAHERLLARSSHWFRAVRPDPNPNPVIWPAAPYDSIWVGEDIRRLVPPRRPVYNRLLSPPEREYVERLTLEIDLVIGRRIRSTRIMHGMRQVDLAACLGISPASLCRIEQGKRPASFADLVRIATQLAVPLEMFVTPPADFPANEWVRRRRRKRPTAQQEAELLEAIIQEELPDLLEAYGVETREELEAIWDAMEAAN